MPAQTLPRSRHSRNRPRAERAARPSRQTPGTNAGPVWRLAALIVAAGVLVFGNSLWGQFIYDDADAIVGNPGIRQLWPVWDALNSPKGSPVAGRPIVSLSFAANYALGVFQKTGCSTSMPGVGRRFVATAA